MKPGRKLYTTDYLVERGIFPEDWEEQLYEISRQGKGKTYYVEILNIPRDTIYKLIKRDEKFKKVVDKCMSLAEQWWVDKVIDSFENENSQRLNTNLWKYMVQNQFRDSGWTDETKMDITSKGDKINDQNQIQIEIIKPKEDDDENNQ